MDGGKRLVVVVGPPGSGKGALCQALCLDSCGDRTHIGIGDAVRKEVEMGTELGLQCAPYIRGGALVTDALAQLVLQEELGRTQSSVVFVDGYPRTGAQSLTLSQMGEVERVILLQARDATCLERIQNRRVDPQTQTVYNLVYAPPPDAQVAARLVRRESDMNENVVRQRLAFYHKSIGRVLAPFQGRISVVNANRPLNEVKAEVELILAQDQPQVLTNNAQQPPPQQQQQHQQQQQQCVVCMGAPSEWLCLPCGHQCGCESCLSQIYGGASPKCPICRTGLQGILRVFQAGMDGGIDEGEKEVVQEEPPGDDAAAEDDGGWGAHDSRTAALLKSQAPAGGEVRVLGVHREGGCHLAISIQPPVANARVAVDMCCVIDISGSMSDDCKFQDPTDETKWVSEGFSILDVVKHAVKTLIATLTSADRLAIVAFDTKCESVFSLGEMNGGGKEQAIKALEGLMPRGGTNIWCGLEGGLDALRAGAHSSLVPRKATLCLLTDGQPVDSPPDGEAGALKRYYETHPDFRCNVSTFGFGYALKSKLLFDVAEEGNGTFGFIPDAKIVGTCFVNYVSNACSMWTQNGIIHIAGVKVTGPPLDGNLKWRSTSWATVVELGPLWRDQSREIVVPIDPQNLQQLDKVVVTLHVDQQKIVSHHAPLDEPLLVARAYYHGEVVHTLGATIDLCQNGRGKEATEALKVFAGKMAVAKLQDPALVHLSQDIEGRVLKAVSTVERFNRWGCHYLRALLTAHKFYCCTNYMDPGLQHYGGSLFRDLRDEGGKQFLAIPMKKTSDYRSDAGNPASSASSSNNVTYYAGAAGGCFSPESRVDELGGVPISTLKKGDVVNTSGSRVVCVVEMQGSATAPRNLVETMGGLKLTPNHPVRCPSTGAWIHPPWMIASDSPLLSHGGSVWNVVLDREPHVISLNSGVECLTLGHGETQGVALHPFYGNMDSIVSALRQIDESGFSQGFVKVPFGRSLREWSSHN